MDQTNHFFNLGYGWLCKHCSAEKAEQRPEESRPGQLFPEHKAGMPKPRPAGLALARWTDSTRHALKCPHCGIEELVKKA